MEIVLSRDLTSRFKIGMRSAPYTLIMPIGDIQYGTPDCNVQMLREHIRWGIENNAYFIGMGDYGDYASPSNRLRLKSAGLYDGTQLALERAGRLMADELFEDALKPSVGRWLGMVRGHHYMDFADGTNSDQYLAAKLNAPHLGTCGLLGLEYNEGIVEILVHHGTGYGQTVGSPLARLERQAANWPTVHVFLVGHQHKIVAARHPEKMYPLWNSGTLSHQSSVIACTGSFMRGYLANRIGPSGQPEGSYVEQKFLPPVALGGILLHIRPRIREGSFAPDIHVTL